MPFVLGPEETSGVQVRTALPLGHRRQIGLSAEVPVMFLLNRKTAIGPTCFKDHIDIDRQTLSHEMQSICCVTKEETYSLYKLRL